MSDVFISHVNHDEPIAREVARCLEEAGFSTWFYERDSVGGPSYIEQVIEAITESRAVLLIISQQSVRSGQVDAEVIEAFESRKPFIPLLNGINYEEFYKLRPSWKLPLRAATALQITRETIASVFPRVIGGLKRMGITPHREPAPADDALPPGSEEIAKQAFAIPSAVLGCVAPGSVLKLEPVQDGAARSLHLIARALFRLGRSRQAADLVTWFWPRNAVNDEKTARLGKVQAIAELRRDGVFLRDGDGAQASANGSQFNGRPLSFREGTACQQRGTLTLGWDYQIAVIPVLLADAPKLRIKNIHEWRGSIGRSPEMRGAVRFEAVNSEPALHDAVWMFSEAAFGTSRANAIVLDLPGLSEIEGRFQYDHGCFWLDASSPNQAVRVDGTPLRRGEIAPLAPGQIIRLGATEFRVQIEP